MKLQIIVSRSGLMLSSSKYNQKRLGKYITRDISIQLQLFKNACDLL